MQLINNQTNKKSKSIYNLKRPVFYGLIFIISVLTPSIILLMVVFVGQYSFLKGAEMGAIGVAILAYILAAIFTIVINNYILSKYEKINVNNMVGKSKLRMPYFFFLIIGFIVITWIPGLIGDIEEKNLGIAGAIQCHSIDNQDEKVKCIINNYYSNLNDCLSLPKDYLVKNPGGYSVGGNENVGAQDSCIWAIITRQTPFRVGQKREMLLKNCSIILSSDNLRESCISSVPISVENCNSIKTKFIKDACFDDLAYYLKDKRLCSLISLENEALKKSCLSFF